MCGITGVFAYAAGSLRLDAATLDRMTDSLAHRGPDDRGTHLDPALGLGLGHRRLSIIDLSPAGHQPMATADGSLWIVLNGEIYNHVSLREELRRRGVSFRSRSDTEVILHLYAQHGDAAVERLEGMFAFALFDARRRRLLLARDRIGVKPLIYAEAEGHFFFASEPRALLQHPLVPRTLDRRSLLRCLSFLSAPAPETVFEGIRKLPAGHRMLVDRAGVRIERFWDALDAPPVADELARDDPVAASEVRRILQESVRARMMSDVPFGVFLSGGVDSSANVALMAACSDRPVETFTVGYDGAKVGHLNELEHARRIAERYGTNHHEVIIDHGSVLRCLPELVECLDEPVLDPVCVPLLYVSRLARESGIRVIQVGEGSDELFLGYDTYMQALRMMANLRWFTRAPRGMRSAIHRAVSPLLRAVGHRASDWDRVLARGVPGGQMFWGGAVQMDDRDKRSLVPDPSSLESGWSIVGPFHDELSKRWPAADDAARITYVELRERLPELLLMRIDKILMWTSVEGREPFLEYRLVELALRLPQAMKLRGGETKALLKRAVADLLPEDLLYRRKLGFPAPMDEWFHTKKLGSLVRETLRTSPLVRDGILSGPGVQAIVDEHFSGRKGRGRWLWTLFMLSLWYRRWILGEHVP